MKILHFFKTYRPDTVGGVENVIYSLAEGSTSYGIESDVLFLSRRGRARDEALNNHTIHRSKLVLDVASTGLSYAVIKDFKELAARADVIHYHFPWPMMDVAHFLARHRKPSVVSYHADIVKQQALLAFYKPLMHQFFSQVNVIVASSPNYVNSSEVLQGYEDKIKVIPYGIEDVSARVSTDAIAKWKDTCGQGFFLFVGKLRYYKGLSYLLQAAKITGLPVVIAGDGANEVEIRLEAENLGVRNVKFVGPVNEMDKAALLSLCRAFVFPSHLRSESFGISLLEAAMFSKPMITCEIGTGTTYVNLNRKTGLSVPPADPAALGSAMRQLWSDDSLVASYGAEARKRFNLLFTRKKMCDQYYQIYSRLIGN